MIQQIRLIPGIKSPKFYLGDRVVTSFTDPDEGPIQEKAIISGLVWRGNYWEYSLLFTGYSYSDDGYLEKDLAKLERDY